MDILSDILLFYRKQGGKHGFASASEKNSALSRQLQNTDYSIYHPEKSNRYVNCIMWTLLSRQKNKLFYGFDKGTPFFEYSFRSVADYIDDVNNRRIQTKTNWMSPSEFRKAPMMAIWLFNFESVSKKLGTYHSEQVLLAFFCLSAESWQSFNHMARTRQESVPRMGDWD